MRQDQCSFEAELLEALESGRWPDACCAELSDHVAECQDCHELSLVADALISDRRSAVAVADVPSSGAVWWRIKMRSEREAKEVASKAVRRAHGAIIAATVAMVIVILVMTSMLQSGWRWLKSAVPTTDALVSISSSTPMALVILVTVLLVVFAPVVLYLAVDRE